MTQLSLAERLDAAERYYGALNGYSQKLAEARLDFNTGQYRHCEKLLSEFPTTETLLVELIGKLKGKSVYRTLKQINEGRSGLRKSTILKGLFSLCTHALIESETRPEFEMVVHHLYERIGKELFD